MAVLNIENIPDDLYAALQARARQHCNSVASEVLSLLQENIPTAKELKARRAFVRRLQRLRSQRPATPGPFPSAELVQREDRQR